MTEWDEDVILRVGGVWKLNEHVSVSTQYSYDLEAFGSAATDS